MTKEQKALEFVTDLVNRFREDIDKMKADQEPDCINDSLNHLCQILSDAGEVVDEEN